MAVDTKNVKVSEFSCHCGCGYNVIDQRVMDIAQRLREELGVPVRVNSGCRCERHNARCGGVKGSYHVKGKAADLSCKLGAVKMFEAVKRLEGAGELPGLEYCILYRGKNFIHVDCGGKRRVKYEERN